MKIHVMTWVVTRCGDVFRRTMLFPLRPGSGGIMALPSVGVLPHHTQDHDSLPPKVHFLWPIYPFQIVSENLYII